MEPLCWSLKQPLKGVSVKFDVLFSISHTWVGDVVTSEDQVVYNFFSPVETADAFDCGVAWLAEPHLSSEFQGDKAFDYQSVRKIGVALDGLHTENQRLLNLNTMGTIQTVTRVAEKSSVWRGNPYLCYRTAKAVVILGVNDDKTRFGSEHSYEVGRRDELL